MLDNHIYEYYTDDVLGRERENSCFLPKYLPNSRHDWFTLPYFPSVSMLPAEFFLQKVLKYRWWRQSVYVSCRNIWLTVIYDMTHSPHHIPPFCFGNMFPVRLIERNLPPPGGFLFTMFPDQERGGRGPPSKNLYQVLRGGSSYSRFLIREHSK